MSAALPAVTSLLALLFAVLLLDQWRDRRHGFQPYRFGRSLVG